MRLEEIELLPPLVAEDFPAVNTAASEVIAAPGAGKRHWIRGITVSCDAAPGAALTVTLRSGAGTVMDQFYIPNAAFAPIVISYRPPLKAGVNEAVTFETTATSGGAKVGVVVRYVTGSA